MGAERGLGTGDRGLGTGDWGLGTGDWGPGGPWPWALGLGPLALGEPAGGNGEPVHATARSERSDAPRARCNKRPECATTISRGRACSLQPLAFAVLEIDVPRVVNCRRARTERAKRCDPR